MPRDTRSDRAFKLWGLSILAGALCGPVCLVLIRMIENPALDIELHLVGSLIAGAALGVFLTIPALFFLASKPLWLSAAGLMPGAIIGGMLVGLLTIVPVGVAVALLWYAAFTVVISRTHDVARIQQGRCARCGYSLEGINGHVCPECGQEGE